MTLRDHTNQSRSRTTPSNNYINWHQVCQCLPRPVGTNHNLELKSSLLVCLQSCLLLCHPPAFIYLPVTDFFPRYQPMYASHVVP